MPSWSVDRPLRFLRRLTRGSEPLPPFRNLQGDVLTPTALAVRADEAVRSLIARRIRTRMDEHSLSNAVLARRLDKDEGTISKLLHE